MFAYAGSRTTRERNAHGDGLTVFRVEPESGALEPIQVLGDLVNPSYLLLDRPGRHLYAIHGDLEEVSAFAVDSTSGRLRFLNRQSTQGRNPVHLALSPDGGHLIVSNHQGGSLAVLPVASDGTLQPVAQLLKLEGPIGPHRVEQTQAKPHFNGFDPSGDYVIVPDKGLDRIFSLRFSGGRLSPAPAPFVATREEAGPRHHAFHPRRPLAYVVNELDSTVTAYRFEHGDGSLTPLQRLSTLPEDFAGDSRASGLRVSPDGRTLYASNRGHDSIAVFAVDPLDGRLRFVEATPSGGRKPRYFTLDPAGRRLYALNEDSDSIVAFAVDAQTGRLTRRHTDTACGSPVCLIFS
ncbi:MAG: lactonase family protein [Curvibacter sp.]|nr:lactonase family protein [Curvibacter sp.]